MTEWKIEAAVLRGVLKERASEIDGLAEILNNDTPFTKSDLNLYDGQLLNHLDKYDEHFEKLVALLEKNNQKTNADYDMVDAVRVKGMDIKKMILALRKSGPAQATDDMTLQIGTLLERIKLLQSKENKVLPDVDFGSSLMKAKFDMTFPEMSNACQSL